MQKIKGFTIIELLVVVAIIAVLAAIVMVNVTQYLNKGRNAAIIGNLSTVQTRSAVYFDDTTLGNGDFIGLGTDTVVGNAETAIETITGATTDFVLATTTTTGADYCACAPLLPKSGTINYYCVDSTGAKVQNTIACSTSCTAASPGCN